MNLIVLLTLVLLGGSCGAAGYCYTLYQKALATQGVPTETQSLLTIIGRVFELPTGEMPTLVTVTDTAKLSGQVFFKHAENGDKVLLYAVAKKAFLYRPSTGKLINVASLGALPSSGDSGQQSFSGSTPPLTETVAGASTTDVAREPVRVALYNGTDHTGITIGFAEDVLAKNPIYETVLKQRAAKNTYEKTVVVDVSHHATAYAEQLSAQLGVELTALPDGEHVPDHADILIILGTDRAESALRQ